MALGITTEGVKMPLGLWEGSSENATVATALLSNLVERGLDSEQGILFVIDRKALRKAIRTCSASARPCNGAFVQEEGMEETLTPHPPRDRRQPEGHSRVDEPVRVDDRVRPPLGAQRQALAVG
ncbi:MAG: transposase [Actinomycetota bacterium]|nr:transposase [Actinomycetota bacterium]